MSTFSTEKSLDDYIHTFNNIRIHGTLGYRTPVEFKQWLL
ncbi:MAG: IS3 family transposase [Bacillus sp. (in: firmicutes)]